MSTRRLSFGVLVERYSGGSRETTTTVATDTDFKRFQASVKIK